MKIKILVKENGVMPEILKVGDGIDLYTTEEYTFKCPHAKMLHKQKNEEEKKVDRYRDVVFTYGLLDLGVAMKLPDGYEGILVPRSSTFKKWGIMQTNSLGWIDETYCGEDDVWKMPVIATRNVTIPKGTPIAQFRIQLSQKATMWQKIKWLFSSKIELEKVDSLEGENRGGLGTGSDKYRTK